MSVMVYSRLGDLLHRRRLTVHDLQRQMAARFGLVVDTRTLDRLIRAERVRRPNLEIAAAAAALDVGLSDVFAVEAVPADDADTITIALGAEEDILDPEQSHRLHELFDLRDRQPLTEGEQAEMRALVAEYGHRVQEKGLRELAQQRNLPVEHVRAEVTADLERRLAWWQEVQADPVRLETLVTAAHDRQRARASR